MSDQSLSLSTSDLVESWLTQLWLMRIQRNTIAKFAPKLFAHQTALVVLVMLTKILFLEEWVPDPTIGCMSLRVMWTMWNIYFMKSNLSGQPDHCDQPAWSRGLSRGILHILLSWFRPMGHRSGTKWSLDPNFQLIALMCPNNHRI